MFLGFHCRDAVHGCKRPGRIALVALSKAVAQKRGTRGRGDCGTVNRRHLKPLEGDLLLNAGANADWKASALAGSITKSAVASMAHGEIISEQRSPGGQGMQPGRFASLGTVNNASSSCSRAGGLRSQG